MHYFVLTDEIAYHGDLQYPNCDNPQLHQSNENEIIAKWRPTRDSFVHETVPYGESMVRMLQ